MDKTNTLLDHWITTRYKRSTRFVSAFIIRGPYNHFYVRRIFHNIRYITCIRLYIYVDQIREIRAACLSICIKIILKRRI